MVGQVLSGRYELEELVGTGGMSSVYRAHDRLLARKVALKVLHEHYGADEAHVERFRREARAVATLSHPNIVAVIDRGEHEGRQFIVFEYVEGENLKRLIERDGPLPVATALELAIQIARGLSFAHGQGLVHRDVKPQNVLLNGDGAAKVTDFGIARSLDVQHGMTQTGTVLGTSDYIAPEQAQGRRVDEHSDIYSLGVVLYELLTSKVPFPGENFVAVAMRHINEPPPSVRDERPDVPLRLDAALQTAMAKDPGDRFPTMAAFCHELEACLRELSLDGDGTQIIAPPTARAHGAHGGVSPWPVLALLVALLAIGAIVAALVLTGHSPGGGGGTPSGGGARSTSPPSPPTTRSARAASTTSSRTSRPTATPRRSGRPSTTTTRRASPASPASGSSSTPGAPSRCTDVQIATLDARLHRGDQGRRLADLVHRRTSRRRRPCRGRHAVRDHRRGVPLLRGLDHAARAGLRRTRAINEVTAT